LSNRARTRAIAVAAVLLTAAVTAGTALLPTSAHAAEPREVRAQAQGRAQVQASPSARSVGDGEDTGTLAGGALAFTATGVALAFGIRLRGRQH
jgi:hypothetical protein